MLFTDDTDYVFFFVSQAQAKLKGIQMRANDLVTLRRELEKTITDNITHLKNDLKSEIQNESDTLKDASSKVWGPEFKVTKQDLFNDETYTPIAKKAFKSRSDAWKLEYEDMISELLTEGKDIIGSIDTFKTGSQVTLSADIANIRATTKNVVKARFEVVLEAKQVAIADFETLEQQCTENNQHIQREFDALKKSSQEKYVTLSQAMASMTSCLLDLAAANEVQATDERNQEEHEAVDRAAEKRKKAENPDTTSKRQRGAAVRVIHISLP